MRLLADLHISPSTGAFLRSLSGARSPSLVTLRLASSRVAHVNEILGRVLPQIEGDLIRGSAVTVEDSTIRIRGLPIE